MRERLQKILSAHGAASRREAEKLIKAGRVTVNGAAASLGQSADYACDEILIDGVPLKPKDAPVYIMLNKPRGYVTTMRDERRRKTVRDLVPEPGVYPAGRLDMDSEGLLIMTNDGQFANAVMHPSYNKAKTYEVHVRGDVSNAEQQLSRPMQIDSYTTRPATVKLQKRTERGGVLLITIHEGRNRQVRKMCAICGLNVDSLRRVSIGEVKLGELKPGQWRRLTDEEIRVLAGAGHKCSEGVDELG